MAKTRVLMVVFAARLRIARIILEPIIAASASRARYWLYRALFFGKRLFRSVVVGLQRFDQWAAAKIKQRDDLSEIQKLLRESTKVLAQWLSQVRTFVIRLPRKFDR